MDRKLPPGATAWAAFREVDIPTGRLKGAHWIRQDDGTWKFYAHNIYRRGFRKIGTLGADGVWRRA